MKFIMATEAQKIISISLAKIAASRCVRGGVSLHKNLLVATVLQKARYIFMEEAFHMVHGHYINQANSKFIQQLRYQEQLENQLRHGDKEYDDENDDSTVLDDSELDLFSSPIDSNESLNFLNDLNKGSSTNSNNNLMNNNNNNTSNNNNNNHKYNSSTTSSSDLIYLDLDVKSQSEQSSNSITSGHKRRHSDDTEYDSDEAILSIFPTKSKQMKFSNNEDESSEEESSSSSCSTTSSSSNSSSSSENTDNCLSLDFLSNDLNLTSSSQPTSTHTSTSSMAPLDMSNNTSASPSNSQTSSSSSSSSTAATVTTSSSIDRITSLVSIFNFGNLQRTVSTPDLCSSSSNHSTVDNSCCNLQRQIVMTV